MDTFPKRVHTIEEMLDMLMLIVGDHRSSNVEVLIFLFLA